MQNTVFMYFWENFKAMKLSAFIIRAAAVAAAALAGTFSEMSACTGISFKAGDGSYVLARTAEWGGSDLQSRYVIVPRGFRHTALTSTGGTGLIFTGKYGYVGVAAEQDQFVLEGLNEKGLSAGLFFFPAYGQYSDFDSAQVDRTVPDMQVVSWILANFTSVQEVIDHFDEIIVTKLYPQAGTSHWRVGEPSGRQIVIEIVDGKTNFYENEIGVLTNAPGFPWQVTNLNNYVNLAFGEADGNAFSAWPQVRRFGAGTGMIGIPGDVTPPSRFVRAAYYQATAPQYPTAEETVMYCFLILNNFDIPIGVERQKDHAPVDIPGATQFTTAADTKGLKFYWRTCWNSTIRCIDLTSIDFTKVRYTVAPLDKVRQQPVEMIKVR